MRLALTDSIASADISIPINRRFKFTAAIAVVPPPRNGSKNFDLVVIGTGAAASTVAYKCNAAGWKVAVIDSRPFGGTCALSRCNAMNLLRH